MEFVNIKRKSGWYEAEEYDFIRDMLRSSNRRRTIGRVFYDPDSKTIKVRNKRSNSMFDSGFKLTGSPLKNITKLKKTGVQPTGGYQELKKGGKLAYGRGYANISISYSAFDKTRPLSTFNYAALQHDNLAFKHMKGKKPLFLYRAFEQNVNKWLKDIGAKQSK